MHFYPFNIGDYRKDTTHLTPLEHGIYRLLLDTYYLTEMPLSLSENELMRMHGIRTQDEKEAFSNIIKDFFIKQDDGFHHDGCEKVLSKIYEKSDKAKKSAVIKWEKERAKKALLAQKKSEENANASKNHANAQESDANALKNDAIDMLPITHNPLLNNPLPKNINTSKSAVKQPDIDFTEFWKIYPRKVEKLKAEEIWKRINPSMEIFEQIKKHLAVAYIHTEKQFIMHPTKYLNGRRWEDEVFQKLTNKPKQNFIQTSIDNIIHDKPGEV